MNARLIREFELVIDEMQGEGVSVEKILELEVSEHSAHWQRTQQFIAIAKSYLDKVEGKSVAVAGQTETQGEWPWCPSQCWHGLGR